MARIRSKKFICAGLDPQAAAVGPLPGPLLKPSYSAAVQELEYNMLDPLFSEKT
jgi:hypothetical protein